MPTSKTMKRAERDRRQGKADPAERLQAIRHEMHVDVDDAGEPERFPVGGQVGIGARCVVHPTTISGASGRSALGTRNRRG